MTEVKEIPENYKYWDLTEMDNTELPAFVAELESRILSLIPTYSYAEHVIEPLEIAGTIKPISAEAMVFFYGKQIELLALVRQLQGERDQDSLLPVYQQIKAERDRQDEQWGESNHASGTGIQYIDDANIARIMLDCANIQGEETWQIILRKWFFKAVSSPDSTTLRKRLVQVAAVAVAWIECIDRKAGSNV